MSGCNKVHYVVRLRQMLRCWRKWAASNAQSLPSDVAAGHVVVAVGSSSKRFVVRVSHLNHPLFKKLLHEAEEEYGFTSSGPLTIPCEEKLFEEIIRFVGRSEPGSCSNLRFISFDYFQTCCRLEDFRNNLLESFAESRPLLHGFSDKSIW